MVMTSWALKLEIGSPRQAHPKTTDFCVSMGLSWVEDEEDKE